MTKKKPDIKRETEVSLRLTEKAKEIYDKLPAKGKGIWVSEAIEEKHNKESNPFTEEQEQRIIDIIKEVMK